MFLRIEFLEGIIFVGHASNDVELSPAMHELLVSWGTKRTKHLADHPAILPDPYIGVEGNLWQVLRLYDDVQGAFLIS
jgi:hypothetical protein